MPEQRYYLGFDHVEAMQWVNGSNGDALAKFLGRSHADWTNNRGSFICYGSIIKPNQWVIKKQNEDIIIQDAKPAELKKWIWGAATPSDTEPEAFESEQDARDPGKKWLMGCSHKVYRKPVVQVDSNPSNTWTGPWELAD